MELPERLLKSDHRGQRRGASWSGPRWQAGTSRVRAGQDGRPGGGRAEVGNRCWAGVRRRVSVSSPGRGMSGHSAAQDRWVGTGIWLSVASGWTRSLTPRHGTQHVLWNRGASGSESQSQRSTELGKRPPVPPPWSPDVPAGLPEPLPASRLRAPANSLQTQTASTRHAALAHLSRTGCEPHSNSEVGAINPTSQRGN